MLVELFTKFRISLILSTGFQSILLRLMKFISTELIKLNNIHLRENIERNTSYNYAYQNYNWQASGKNHSTSAKSTMLI